MTWWLPLYNWDDRAGPRADHPPGRGTGCSGIVPLVNTTADVSHTPARVGYRLPAGGHLRLFRSRSGLDYGLTEEYIEWMAKLTSLPIIPKGIVRGDDALRAVNAGARGIMVSNHGGRQLSTRSRPSTPCPGSSRRSARRPT